MRPAKPMLTAAMGFRTVMESPSRAVRDDKDRPDMAPWKLNAVGPYGFGAAALFSGMALVAHILSRVPLRLLLATTIGLAAIAVRVMWRRSVPNQRAVVIRCAGVGVLSGLLATGAYDLSKFALSRWGPFAYNPFEVIRVFGALLVGATAPLVVIYSIGAAFHILNGTCLGIAFCLLFGRRGIVAGIAWGIFLEVFQLTLYPGWLDIRAYGEFAQISALSHLVYGSILGWCCQRGMRR